MWTKKAFCAISHILMLRENNNGKRKRTKKKKMTINMPRK